MDSSLFFSFCAIATLFTLLVYISIKLYRKFRFHHEDRITDVSSSSSSSFSCLSLSHPVSSLSRNWKHHVFPSFHGEDVRKNFLSHIQKEFKRKGIDLFLDNHIERSKSIGPELVEAIRESKIAIVLFSKNYASSSWCLNELVEILKCREEFGQTVMTVFYEVDPTDVKKQTGGFGKTFTKTCKGRTKEEIIRWKKALESAATIAGEHSRNWDNEATMIDKITTDVSNMLNTSTPSRDFEGFIGMGAHIRVMESLLRLDLDEVRMVGIWGPSGIGKTTIARCLFNQVSSSFQFSTIMVNIKACYPRPCLDEYSTQLQLQQRMLSQMIDQKDIMISHLGVAKERLKNKKVFLVLDDVDQLGQLLALAKEIQWFGPGSRIIITTENIRVLNAHKVNHIYKVKFPEFDEAFQIFCMYAFGQKEPYDGFFELAWETVELAGKLPLGLKVLGSYFRGMSPEEWVMALPRLNTCLDGEIESVLKFSYDALCDEDKDLFLYIACFFNDQKTRKVETHLAKRFLDVKQGIHVLAEKSLIDIRMGYIEMHNLLVQHGKKIARKQWYDDPRKLYFLVEKSNSCEALNYDTIDCKRVIGIDLGLHNIMGEGSISEKALERMSNLQFLRFNGSNDAMQNLNYQYKKLRYLHCWNFPLTCFPSTLNPEFLIELNMSYSKLYKLWEGNKPLKNLKWMDLSYSTNLKELPDLSTAKNLEELILSGCSSLVELHSSIGNLTSLFKLYLDGCSSLTKLTSARNATNVQILNLSDCSNPVEISSIRNATNLHQLNIVNFSGPPEVPNFIGPINNLQEFSFYNHPSPVGNLCPLRILRLTGCKNLKVLPDNINLESLYELDLTGCSQLKRFPEISTNIRELSLVGTAIEEVPSSIKSCSRLKYLSMQYFGNLNEFPHAFDIITGLHVSEDVEEVAPWVKEISRLRKLVLKNCKKLVSLPQLPDSLSHLDAENCGSLERLDCSFNNPKIQLNFTNCFKLNNKARELVMQAKDVILPGLEVPAFFNHALTGVYRRTRGDSTNRVYLTVNLNQKPLRNTLRFKTCIMLDKGNDETWDLNTITLMAVYININGLSVPFGQRFRSIHRPSENHLYVFEVEPEEKVTPTKLDFVFSTISDIWRIRQCGVFQIV